MKKFFSFFIAGIMVSTLAFSADLADGSYRAEYKNFDKYGWKPFLELVIEDGTVVSANSDYVNKKGKLKSKDAAYNARMKKKCKTSPAEYKPLMEKQLLKKQSAENLDGISGATHSFQNFRILAKSIFKNAKIGKTETIVLD